MRVNLSTAGPRDHTRCHADAGLHNPGYDFDDSAIRHGVSCWLRLVETTSEA